MGNPYCALAIIAECQRHSSGSLFLSLTHNLHQTPHRNDTNWFIVPNRAYLTLLFKMALLIRLDTRSISSSAKGLVVLYQCNGYTYVSTYIYIHIRTCMYAYGLDLHVWGQSTYVYVDLVNWSSHFHFPDISMGKEIKFPLADTCSLNPRNTNAEKHTNNAISQFWAGTKWN